ncbi:MAG: hypothetical protein CL607_07115 [Anaerolineaceae bacterium]|nr:hypothetical protein [Anaerolineaceae bacterium]
MSQHLVPIAENIWVYPTSTEPNTIQPNVGVIACGDQVVMVDAGSAPPLGRVIASEIMMLGLRQVDTLIYTHHHWDHIVGAMAYTPRHIIAHEQCATMLDHLAQRDWLQEDVELPPQMVARLERMATQLDRWHDFRLLQPNMTFSHELTLHINDTPIELAYVAGRHAQDSIVVKFPQAGVMFLGDCYYPPPQAERPPEGDDDLAIAMLEALYAEGYETYIDGHGPPRDRDALATLIDAEKARQGTA